MFSYMETTSWMPLLRDNNMVTEAQFTQIKGKVDAWRSAVEPPRTTLYIVIAAVVLVVLLVLYRRMKKGPKMPPAA